MFSQPVPAGRAQSNLPFNINDFNNDLNANNFNNNDVLPNFAPQRQQHTLPIIPPQPIPLQQAPPTKNAPERQSKNDDGDAMPMAVFKQVKKGMEEEQVKQILKDF